MILFLARRFFGAGSSAESKPALRIATLGVAVGLCVMIVSICVVRGFQKEVRANLAGFASHVEVVDPRSYASPEAFPVEVSKEKAQEMKQTAGAVRCDRVGMKMGVIKTENDFAGIILKGVEPTYDLAFLKSHLVEGSADALQKSGDGSQAEILLSRRLAQDLKLRTGQRIFCYFFGKETIKQRRYRIAGIYDTHLKSFDDVFAICPLSEVQRINSWTADEVSGVEVRLADFDQIAAASLALNRSIAEENAGRLDAFVNPAQAVGLQENPRTASVCTWLELLDMNVYVILALMLLLSCVTMTSGLLILILERTSTIGTLRALGATASSVRRTFLSFALMITLRGLVLGYALGLGICFAQQQWSLVRLDPEQYYVDAVPVSIEWHLCALLGLATLLLTALALIIPSHLASRIEPARAIRFD